jgi:hypothetical protein
VNVAARRGQGRQEVRPGAGATGTQIDNLGRTGSLDRALQQGHDGEIGTEGILGVAQIIGKGVANKRGTPGQVPDFKQMKATHRQLRKNRNMIGQDFHFILKLPGMPQTETFAGRTINDALEIFPGRAA